MTAPPAGRGDAGGLGAASGRTDRMPASRRVLGRLRETMARGPASLSVLVGLVATEMVAEVCSIYAMRPGDLLELAATHGLRPEAVGRTRLRVGEGIVGLVAATGEVMNLPDAQNHPAFAYRPETGEEPYASLLGVPVRRAGRTLGVLAVQNRMPRLYEDDEVEIVETVAMLLAEALAAGGAHDGAEEGLGASMTRQFEAAVLSPGVVLGPVIVLGGAAAPRRLLAEEPEAELRRLNEAAEAMRHDLDALIAAGLPEGGPARGRAEMREVLNATRLLAADSGWLRRVADAVRGGLTAEAAVHRVSGELQNRIRRLSDPTLRERLADFEDLAGRLLAALDGAEEEAQEVPPGAVLVARRLGPAQLLAWHARGISGLLIEEGSPAGHAAILARTLSLPALGDVRGVIAMVQEGDEAVLDADEGRLVLRPEADIRLTYERALQARNAREAGWTALRERPSCTADGVPFRLMLNIGLPLELDALTATGAEGIGLFRTEIAMLARGGVADIPEQVAIYARVLDAAAGRPVVFRTLDLGGDKLLPGASTADEENPAMGWRSLRIALDRPAVLRRQARALLLAATGRPLTIMFPMVATVAEFRQARALVLSEAERIDRPPARLELGTMLEVPSLLWQMPALLAEVDFVSIGSNDLLQFLFAADRGTRGIADRYDLLSAPVLDMLEAVSRAAGTAGVPLSLCGAAASRPLEALTLAALGITTLSMPATSLLPVKALLTAADLGAFRTLLAVLRRTGAAEASLRETLLAWAQEHALPL